jgi:hypothetical protein
MCAGLGLKPKHGSQAGPKPMVKKNYAGFGFSSVDSDPGLLGIFAGSELGSVPAQLETSSVAFLSVSVVWQFGSSQKFVSPIDSRFSFPLPLRSPEVLSLAPLVAYPRFEGTSSGLVSNVVGSFSLGASSMGVACSALQSISDVLPVQVFYSSQSFIASSQSFSGVAKLGKRLGSSSPVLSDYNPFQKYYRKAREARKVHLDKIFFFFFCQFYRSFEASYSSAGVSFSASAY